MGVPVMPGKADVTLRQGPLDFGLYERPLCSFSKCASCHGGQG